VSAHFSVEPIELLLPSREFRMNNRHLGQIAPNLLQLANPASE
jgi:hypothetical protein